MPEFRLCRPIWRLTSCRPAWYRIYLIGLTMLFLTNSGHCADFASIRGVVSRTARSLGPKPHTNCGRQPLASSPKKLSTQLPVVGHKACCLCRVQSSDRSCNLKYRCTRLCAMSMIMDAQSVTQYFSKSHRTLHARGSANLGAADP